MLIYVLAAFLQTATFHLTVIGGTGSGDYVCGDPVKIVGDKKRGSEVFGQWFAGWDGDTAIKRVHKRKATLTMPCHDAEAVAKFAPKAPKRKP